MRKASLDLGLAPSAIRSLFEYGKKQKELLGEDKVFDFSIGNPSTPAPEVAKNTLIQLLENTPPEQLHGYTSAPGDLDVRNAIAHYLNKTYGTKTKGELIYLTCGAAASLCIALNALLNEGDEAILFAPHFPEYKVFVEAAQGKAVVVSPDHSTFEPDFADFSAKSSPKTTVVIIDSPNNPSGIVYSEKTIQRIAGILQQKQQEYGHPIYLLSDEPYRELIYDDIPYPFITNYYDNAIVAYSLSKSLSLPGERIGYLLVNPSCADAKNVFAAICGSGRSLGYVCAPALFQYMIPSCLGQTSDIEVYKSNRDFLYNSLVALGYEPIYPTGAFYMLVKALEEDANAFSEKAKKLNLLLPPSDSFGIKGYVRLSYCVSKKTIEASLPAFKKLKESYGDL